MARRCRDRPRRDALIELVASLSITVVRLERQVAELERQQPPIVAYQVKAER